MHALASVDPLHPTDDDLAPVADAVGTARVVLLGEPRHGDAEALQLKARVALYLNRALGFRGLAFEAGLLSCELAAGRLGRGDDPRAALADGLHAVWLVAELEGFFLQLQRQELRVSGFDSHLSSMSTLDAVGPWLAARLGPSWPAGATDRVTALCRATVPFNPQQTSEDRAAARADLSAARAYAADPLTARVIQLLLGGEQVAHELVEWQLPRMGSPDWFDETDPSYRELFNRRDRLMADTLLWSLDHVHKGQRVVGWLANGHALRSTKALRSPDGRVEGVTPMGVHVSDALGDDLRVLLVTLGEGHASLGPLAPPRPGSAEDVLQAEGRDIAFADLRAQPAGSPLAEEIVSRVWGGDLEVTGDLRQVADGLLHVRHVSVTTPLR